MNENIAPTYSEAFLLSNFITIIRILWNFCEHRFYFSENSWNMKKLPSGHCLWNQRSTNASMKFYQWMKKKRNRWDYFAKKAKYKINTKIFVHGSRFRINLKVFLSSSANSLASSLVGCFSPSSRHVAAIHIVVRHGTGCGP